ncbi:MAG: 1-deoxy-D-xylulose-5-phosphate synthase [Candidatus Omnitrophota bacterium]
MSMLLDSINSPQDLRKLAQEKLPELAHEIRSFIIKTVSETGGHLAPSLGAVDVIISLHYCLNTPKDTIVWDVGHQAYAHKILTERRDKFHTLRQRDGISGFPNAFESEYDAFTVGHGSTSISTALGMAAARRIKKIKDKTIAFIGDGSLGGGMAFEALNHAGQLQEDLLIVLNDNEFSISRSVGAFSKYLNRVLTNPIYNRIRTQMQDVVKRIPKVGSATFNAARKLEEALKNLLVPGIIFEEMGIRYFGPVDGHNINATIGLLKNVIPIKGPRIIHVVTKKGKGYELAEKSPHRFHGTTPFNIDSGENKTASSFSFTDAFSQKLIELASSDDKIIAVTAAMPEGTGLDAFHEKFPNRFFNVGIAEEHAVGLAAGLAKSALVPVVAIYSTFLQRSYDQIIHDVALQNLHVVFCLDRAGLVGEDGPTHHGNFDIAFMRHVPNIVCMAPKDQQELMDMLEFAIYKVKGPVAIRYPRGSVTQRPGSSSSSAGLSLRYSGGAEIQLGKAEVLREGKHVAILTIGSMAQASLEAADILSEYKISAEVVNMRFIKPIDEDLMRKLCQRIRHIVTVEDGCLKCGFGSAILETINKSGIKNLSVETLGLPDEFITHGKKDQLLSDYGLDAKGIASTVKALLK